MPIDLTLLIFWAKKFIAALVLPPAGPLLLIGAGLFFKRMRALAWLGWCYGVVATMPVLVNWAAVMLEPEQPVAMEAVNRTGAIVILGAGVRREAPEFGGPTVNRLALERLRYGARLARASGKPVLVAGGAPRGGTHEAGLMRDILESEYEVPVKWTESSSLDTRDNAVFSARILKVAGINRITLVTHAIHMPRAQRAFEAAGISVVAAPTGWLGNRDIDYLPGDFIPNAKSAYAGWLAIHEWIGNLAYAFLESESENISSARGGGSPPRSMPRSPQEREKGLRPGDASL